MMTRADMLAADLEAALVEIANRTGRGVACRFLDRLSRLERLASSSEHENLLSLATSTRDHLGGRLGSDALRDLDVPALVVRAGQVAIAGEPSRAIDLGIDVLAIAEIAPWLPTRVDLEPILAWWDAEPASFLALPALAASRRAHERRAPARVHRILSRMSAIAIAVLEPAE
jgi:hypothetical protein